MLLFVVVSALGHTKVALRPATQTKTKQIFLYKHNELKHPNWRKTDQLAIYKRDQEVELGSTEKQLLVVVRTGLEPGFQVHLPNHSATLPPQR